MSIADVKYKELIEKIHKEGVWDKDGEVRTVYADGSAAYTKSIFGVQVEFNKGEIPLLTNKKVFWETALKEMLLFWQKQTVKESDFKEQNVKVWNEWFNDNGDLGRSYSYQFESHRNHKKEIIEVKKRDWELDDYLEDVKANDLVNPNYHNEKYKNDIGKKYQSNFGKYVVIDAFDSGTHYDNSQSAEIQFLNTGYITTVRLATARGGQIKDRYSRTVYGVGYYGDYERNNLLNEKQINALKKIWRSMIERCYGVDTSNRYKGKVKVDKRWHSFENFLLDMPYIPQFFIAKSHNFKGFELDKDYYCSKGYSKDTCVWLSHKENSLYRKNKPVYRISKENERILFLSVGECANSFSGNRRNIEACLKGVYTSENRYRGYTFEYAYPASSHVYRFELSKNQVVELIKNIKNNPYSRRLITNFYSFADMDKKQLVECAYGTNWNVRNGELDLILLQRSADIGLGVVFNWIQYSLLQHMIAHVCGLKPGKFTHQIGNLHYYDRHEETLLSQVNEKTYNEPDLWINPEIKDFFDFTSEDVKFQNYEHGDFLKMEVAI